MRILFVMPKVGAWATHGIHKSPNQLYAHWAAYIREHGYKDVTVIDGERITYWIEHGAQVSDTMHNILINLSIEIKCR